MEGYKHLIIALFFLAGTFLIDLDHYKMGFKEMFIGLFSLDKMQCKERINCQLHKPIIFYISLAFTLGLFIHFKMDGVL